MTASRFLPWLNAAGCVVLVGFILLQWRGGQALTRQLHESRSREILESNARLEAEKTVRQLQSDLEGLKVSIDSIRASAESAEKERAAKAAEVERLAAAVTTAQEAVKTWEQAVKERDAAIAARDEKLREINDALVATRKRLDEAVAELKKAGAR